MNQAQFRYNDFGQLDTDFQAHGGSVNTGTSPKVQYAYVDGSDNTIRPTQLVYPNGRELNLGYGAADSQADLLSRPASFIDDDVTTHLADYSYLGLGTPVVVDYDQPELEYTLVGTAGGDDPDTGDKQGSPPSEERGKRRAAVEKELLDRFGRIKDAYWYDYGNSSDAARIRYGYDRASNRTYRDDVVATAQSKPYDELYRYDGLQRLKDMGRGTLNGGKTALSAESFGQCWTLDATGNWKGFRQDDTGSGIWDLIQARTSNPVNEITNISESAGPSWTVPAYDAAGNMTTVPQPADPTESYTATWDAWNRLVKLVDPTTTDTVQENVYDARHFRIARKDYASGALAETRHFYYTSAWQCVEERLDSETTAERQHVWGLRYIDDLILRDRDTERLYALQDGNWNVIALTDTSGDVQERYSYTPYGTPKFLSPTFTPRTSSSYDQETLYAGYRFDPATGLYAVRYRMLHAELGTWLSRDPGGYATSRNLLEYLDGTPVDAIDPLGLGNWTRFTGFLKMVGGSFESVGGIAMTGVGGAATFGTAGAGAPVGVPAMAGGVLFIGHGYDTAVAGYKQLVSGEPVRTFTSKTVERVTGSETAGEFVDAGLGFASSGPTTAAMQIRNLSRLGNGQVVVYRAMKNSQARTIQRTGEVVARGGRDAKPTAIGKILHPLTWHKQRRPWDFTYKSGYNSTTTHPNKLVAPLCSAADEGMYRLAVHADDLCYSPNVFQAELLLRGGASARVLGKATESERVSRTLRFLHYQGCGQMTCRMGQGAQALMGDPFSMISQNAFGGSPPVIPDDTFTHVVLSAWRELNGDQ